MNFELSTEQSILKDNVQRLVAQEYSLESRKRRMSEPFGWSRKTWKQFAKLGLLGLGFSEEDGGFGGGPAEMVIVMEAIGRGLVLEPYLPGIVLAGGILRHGEAWPKRVELISAVTTGQLLIALAHEEEGARYSLAHVATIAERTASGWILRGRKVNVLSGDSADTILVSARSAGHRLQQDGMSLFAVRSGHPGVSVKPYLNIDGTRSSVVELAEAVLADDALVGGAGSAYPLIERAFGDAIAAQCAEAVGLMDALLEATVTHLKTRRQFGGPIGRFQALQHRAADMYVATEQARSMAIYAAMMALEPNHLERQRALSAAKVQVGKSSRFVGQQAVQLAGGIGVTEEYIVGQYFKRSTVIERQFGDIDHHLSLLDSFDSSF